ncbi:hypothetical protein GCM10023321_08240 [Pseudonocardia eucalypti]|uniref:Uncharacterized protein n=1 Tax=Pseudonocardia eucalypti TaxID=648755 RepID=A0ABP9PJZ0_9PSEU
MPVTRLASVQTTTVIEFRAVASLPRWASLAVALAVVPVSSVTTGCECAGPTVPGGAAGASTRPRLSGFNVVVPFIS